MIYKNYSETASLLAQKIKENFADKNSYSVTFINQESEDFAKKICEYLQTDLIENIHPKNLIIVDNGSTLADEYNEFTDEIRKTHPTTKIILAIPIIPESEVEKLSKNCDTLLYLHSDPYFFSLNQFYEEPNF
jgi:predicted phosphoribosyltransferase